jgi:hypothetical protein
MSDAITKAATLAREMWAPRAAEATRRAVNRYLDTRARHREASEACDDAGKAIGYDVAPVQRLEAFDSALYQEFRDAEAALTRLLVAWDPVTVDYQIDDAEGCYWPGRGVIVDRMAYLTVPLDLQDTRDFTCGESKQNGGRLMGILTFPAALLVNLDGDATIIPAKAAGVPSDASVADRPVPRRQRVRARRRRPGRRDRQGAGRNGRDRARG